MITEEQLREGIELASEDMPSKFDKLAIDSQIKYGEVLERGTASRLKRAIVFSKSAAINPDKECILAALCPVLGSLLIVDVLMTAIGIRFKGNLGRYILSIMLAYFQTYIWIDSICSVLYGTWYEADVGLVVLLTQSLLTSILVRKSAQVINTIAFFVVLIGAPKKGK